MCTLKCVKDQQWYIPAVEHSQQGCTSVFMPQSWRAVWSVSPWTYVCTCSLWVWFWSYHVSISSNRQSQRKREISSLLHCFPCPALHWIFFHSILDCVHSFKLPANQVGYIIVKAWVPMDLWQCKQTLSLGFIRKLSSFTAINPWLCALTTCCIA